MHVDVSVDVYVDVDVGVYVDMYVDKMLMWSCERVLCFFLCKLL